MGFALSVLCAQTGTEGSGGHAPGAQLSAERGFHGGSTSLIARINSPTRPSRFEASIEERHGELGIFRSVEATGPSAAFRFDVARGKAVVAPPRPFSGTGRFERHVRGRGRLLGNLAVDFPGNSDVRLAGPGTYAGLVRYVDNPSHPFRPLASFSPWPSTKPLPTAFATSLPLAPS